jgi:hypothetical protein
MFVMKTSERMDISKEYFPVVVSGVFDACLTLPIHSAIYFPT